MHYRCKLDAKEIDIAVVDKLVKGTAAPLPNQNDVIYVSTIHYNVLCMGILGPDLKILPETHKKVCITGNKACSHCGANL